MANQTLWAQQIQVAKACLLLLVQALIWTATDKRKRTILRRAQLLLKKVILSRAPEAPLIRVYLARKSLVPALTSALIRIQPNAKVSAILIRNF